MSRRLFSLVTALTATGWLMSSTALHAESRVALVIGNSAYESVTQLPNPTNDAQIVATTLNAAGFEVVWASNLGQNDMRQTIRAFTDRVTTKGKDTVALVFYAGHGLQVDGENFLVPVDAKIERESDVSIEAVRLADLMKALENVAGPRIVILDACRNNPFADKKVGGSGLAIVDAPNGSIVAYSTAPGSEALDGKGRHSPYTTAFVEAIKERGLPIEQLLKNVRVKVHNMTDGRQTPWESSSLTANFAFFSAPPALVAQAKPGTPPVTVASTDPKAAFAQAATAKVSLDKIASVTPDEAYDVVIEDNSIEAYEEFIRVFPFDPRCNRLRKLLTRRSQMVAWHKAVSDNTPEAYDAVIARFGDSDIARFASRLRVLPRLRPLDPIFTRKIGPRFGNGRFGNGRFGNGRFGNGGLGKIATLPNGGKIGNPGKIGNGPIGGADVRSKFGDIGKGNAVNPANGNPGIKGPNPRDGKFGGFRPHKIATLPGRLKTVNTGAIGNGGLKPRIRPVSRINLGQRLQPKLIRQPTFRANSFRPRITSVNRASSFRSAFRGGFRRR